MNALYKLDRHYYGMFGFLLMNEKITASLSKYPDAYERIRVALKWLKKNNHIYQQFLACYETIYRLVRPEVLNPEMLDLNQDMILQDKAVGMTFPVDPHISTNILLCMVI